MSSQHSLQDVVRTAGDCGLLPVLSLADHAADGVELIFGEEAGVLIVCSCPDLSKCLCEQLCISLRPIKRGTSLSPEVPTAPHRRRRRLCRP